MTATTEGVSSAPLNVPPVSTETTDLSIVIVSWNTRGLLEDCLRSVYQHLGDLHVEIWVVDNASSDGSAEMVRERFPQTKLIANTDNVGFARANNQALRQAKGRYYLLLNSDTVVPSGALLSLVAALDAHPEAAVCSPLLINADGSPQFCWARFPGLKSELTGHLDIDQSPYPTVDFSDPERRSLMEPFAADWVGGACFLVRANAAEKVGLLDEAFFMYAEETDWCRRFRAAGWKVLLVPGATVTHLGGQSSRAVPGATRQRIWRSRLRLFRLLYGPFGSLLPSTVATARYLLFQLKGSLRRGERKT